MARHFTQSRAYRDFTLAAVKSEDDAFLCLTELAFGHRESFPCPLCKHDGKHYLRLSRRQWRCRKCDGYFSPTSGTALHKRKVSCMTLVHAMVLFCNASNGAAASQEAAALGVDPRTAWLLYSKIREVFIQTWDMTPLTGKVHADGAFFGGKPRRPRRRQKYESAALNSPTRTRKASIDPTITKWKMEPWNRKKLENRRVVLAIRELDPNGKGARRSIISILRAESYAEIGPVFAKCVKPNTTVMTDCGNGFLQLSLNYDLRTVNHSKELATLDGVSNNQAESLFSRQRRGEFGVFRAARPKYLLDYAIEAAWRDDNRRMSMGEKIKDIFKRIRQCGPSPSFCGYYQGHRRGTEWTQCPGQK